ncbi:PBP1A family penicillin-binding protein [Pilibacter termitis]
MKHHLQPKNKKHKGKKKHGWLFKIFFTLFSLGMVLFLLGVGLFFFYASSSPKLSDKELGASASSKIYGLNNELIADLGAEQRVLFEPNELPEKLKDAVISVEDKRFYQNIGIDPVRIVSSLFHNITHSTTQGGSTLTQQLIKLSYFSTKESDQTLKRKAQEAWLAMQLDRRSSKEEILTYYMNKVYMSNGIYGMRTASEKYYGKEPKDLSYAQTALIAGMPQAPNTYNPYINPNYAKDRRDTVLLTMLENQKISKEEYDKAVATPIDDGLQPLKESNQNLKIIDNYVKQVIEEVQEKTGEDLFKKGMDIYTNLDMNAQKRLYDIVNSDQYVDYPDDKFQVAATLVDVKTGKVLAQIGGRKIASDITFGVNQAVETNRDFGSTMKPLTDYGPAIENLDWPTNHMLDDSSYTYPNTNIEVHDWDNQFMGWMTMRQALTLSRNVPAIKALDAVGLDKAKTFLNKVGIDYKQMEYSNAISSNTNVQDGNKYGASSLKMAAAYAAFSNAGVYNTPYYVNKIVFADGTEQTFKTTSSRAMKDSTAYMVTDMMKNVISSGTGNNAQIPGLYQAGKTGTSNYDDNQLKQINSSYEGIAPDENFVGITPYYSLAVWTGYNNRLTPILPDDFLIASEVYRELMGFVSDNVPNKDWVMPDSVLRNGSELSLVNSKYTPQVTKTSESTTSSTSTSTSSKEKEKSSSQTSSTSSSVATPTSSETSSSESSSESVPPPTSSTTPSTPPTSSSSDSSSDNSE